MITFVTGLSGAGKSYVVKRLHDTGQMKGEVIDLDQFTCFLVDPEKNRNIVKNETICYYLEHVLGVQKAYSIDWNHDAMHYHDHFVQWMEQQEKDYIVEGIQVYNGMISQELVKKYKVILVDSSLLRCAFYRIKRALRDGKGLREKLFLVKHNGIVRKFHLDNQETLKQFVKENKDNIIVYQKDKGKEK